MSQAKKESSFVQDAIKLFGITLIAGFLLGVVHHITYEPIERANNATKIEAYQSVFPEAVDFKQHEGIEDLIASAEGDLAAQSFYNGNLILDVVDAKDASGNTIGYIVSTGSKNGFGGEVDITSGLQEDLTVTGIAFLSIEESPGLGMNARDTDWGKQFSGRKADQFTVTKTGSTGDSEIDAISGATITSNAVTSSVNTAVWFAGNYLK